MNFEKSHRINSELEFQDVALAHRLVHAKIRALNTLLNPRQELNIKQVPHQTKSCPNSGSEIVDTKKGTLLALVLLCSMGWGSIKNVGSLWLSGT